MGATSGTLSPVRGFALNPQLHSLLLSFPRQSFNRRSPQGLHWNEYPFTKPNRANHAPGHIGPNCPRTQASELCRFIDPHRKRLCFLNTLCLVPRLNCPLPEYESRRRLSHFRWSINSGTSTPEADHINGCFEEQLGAGPAGEKTARTRTSPASVSAPSYPFPRNRPNAPMFSARYAPKAASYRELVPIA